MTFTVSVSAAPVDDSDADGSPTPAPDLISATAPGLVMLEAILRAGTVTEAARLCGVSQPTLTRAMSRWEATAGTALFDRSRRTIRWTGPGRELATLATSTLNGFRSALCTGRSPKDSLAIGSLHSLGQAVLAELIPNFLKQSPSESVRLIESYSDELVNATRAGAIDLAIVDRPSDLTGLAWHRLGQQRLSLVLPANHPGAHTGRIDLANFKDDKFVALDHRFESRVHADELCAEAGFTPSVVLESDNPSRLRQYVANGIGIAVLPVDLSINPQVKYMPIDSSLAVREFGVVTNNRTNTTARVQNFIANIEALERRYAGWADLLDH